MIACNTCAELKNKFVKAVFLAARYVGGDEESLLEFIPICEKCACTWYEEIPVEEQIPMLVITEKQHEVHNSKKENICRSSEVEA